MRAYNIVITRSSDGSQLANYTTTGANGGTNGKALRVVLDVPVYSYAIPQGMALVRVYGVEFSELSSAKNFNGQNISVSAGMAKGLPLANPSQYGIIVQGVVQQAFGNWQGTEITLDLLIMAVTGTNQNPVNLNYIWKKGQTMQECLTNVLKIAYPGSSVSGSLNSSLIAPEDAPFFYTNLSQLAYWANQRSVDMLNQPRYIGVQITKTPDGFYLTDGTNISAPNQLAFTDLIGNVTWTDAYTINVKTVMRADLYVGAFIKLPVGSNVITNTNSQSNYRNNVSFSGSTFMIVRLRHVGDSRQASGDSWVTVLDAVFSS